MAIHAETVRLEFEKFQITAKYRGKTYYSAGYRNYGSGLHEFHYSLPENERGGGNISHIYVAFSGEMQASFGSPIPLEDFLSMGLSAEEIGEGITTSVTKMNLTVLSPEIEPVVLKAMKAAIPKSAPQAGLRLIVLELFKRFTKT